MAVITGAVDLSDALDPALVRVHNPGWEGGQATSIQAGLGWARQAGHDAVVIGLGDQPLVPGSAWAAVASADSPIAIATFRGARRPPVRLARSVWGLLPTEGDIGARTLIRSRPDLVSEVACEGDPRDVDVLGDLAWPGSSSRTGELTSDR